VLRQLEDLYLLPLLEFLLEKEIAMKRCELFETCAFLNIYTNKYPATVNYLMRAYCKVNHKACARFTVYRVHGSERVPVDLFPSQHVRGELLTR
jgi:hypothetical protein